LRSHPLLGRKLKTLPEGFFAGPQQLVRIGLHGSLHLADQERLPTGLFKGLSALDRFDFSEGSFQNLPSLDDLTVGALPLSRSASGVAAVRTICVCCSLMPSCCRNANADTEANVHMHVGEWVC